MSYSREIYEAWAPESSPWSKFAKPVLFAHVSERRPKRVKPLELDLAQLVDGDPVHYRESRRHASTALVVDLPGAASVAAGMTAAHAGFRPVPLFNALPGDNALVDVWPIVEALEQFAEEIRAARIPPNAPPAFLLDANRVGGGRPFGAFSWFDNRSVCFPTDFPSEAALVSTGISRIVILTSDLSYDLLTMVDRWKRAAIDVERMGLDGSSTPASAGFFGWAQRLAAGYDRAMFRRNESGAFGRRVSAAS